LKSVGGVLAPLSPDIRRCVLAQAAERLVDGREDNGPNLKVITRQE
jgi:hypothetical protein